MRLGMITIKAYANCDHTYIVWIAEAPIDKCLGFALYRLPTGESSPQIVDTFVGPETEKTLPAGTSRPSTVWPIQKFMWSDYLVSGRREVRYQVVAMCGDSFDHMKPGPMSPWSNPVSLVTPPSAPIQACFNRGVVSTQWVARQLKTSETSLKDIVDPPPGTSNKVRDFLGGELKRTLLELLDSQCKAGAHTYASLLANGAFWTTPPLRCSAVPIRSSVVVFV